MLMRHKGRFDTWPFRLSRLYFLGISLAMAIDKGGPYIEVRPLDQFELSAVANVGKGLNQLVLDLQSNTWRANLSCHTRLRAISAVLPTRPVTECDVGMGCGVDTPDVILT